MNRKLSSTLCRTFGCRKRYQWFFLAYFISIPFAWCSPTVTLAWNANTEPDVAGYRVYYGVASRTYTNMTDVGNITTNRIAGLVEGVNYFFAVSAYNAAGAESDFSDEVSYLVPVTLPNQSPTISALSPQSTLQNVTLSVPFTVSDPETPAGNLILTASSSNPQLIPASSMVFGGNGSARTVILSPALNQSGTAMLTISVSDGSLSSSSSFVLTVIPVNSPPSISALPPQSVYEDNATPAIPFTVGDNETPAGNLIVTATSSNPALAPPSKILLGGSGSDRTISVLPATNQSGTVTIRVTVSDGVLNTTASFSLNVMPVNDVPVISSLSNLVIDEDTPSPVLSFTVGDQETAASALLVTANSSNPSLIPAAGIRLSGTSNNRFIQIAPATNQFGSATITLAVSDGAATAISSFLVTVNPVNDPPSISTVDPQTVNEDTPTAEIPVTIGDIESPATSLVLSATSSDPTLVPASAISLGGSGSNRTVTIQPAADQFGTATITLLVSDGNLTTYSSFPLTVNPVNDAPTLSTIKDLTIPRSGSAGPIPFLVGDVESPASNLVVTASCSNPYLITTNGLILGGFDANRTITIKPLRKRTGTATITIQVSDGQRTTSRSFQVAVGTTTFTSRPTIGCGVYRVGPAELLTCPFLGHHCRRSLSAALQNKPFGHRLDPSHPGHHSRSGCDVLDRHQSQSLRAFL